VNVHYSLASFAQVTPAWPGLLILYHRSHAGGQGALAPESDVLDEMRTLYAGRWVSGRDLGVY